RRSRRYRLLDRLPADRAVRVSALPSSPGPNRATGVRIRAHEIGFLRCCGDALTVGAATRAHRRVVRPMVLGRSRWHASATVFPWKLPRDPGRYRPPMMSMLVPSNCADMSSAQTTTAGRVSRCGHPHIHPDSRLSRSVDTHPKMCVNGITDDPSEEGEMALKMSLPASRRDVFRLGGGLLIGGTGLSNSSGWAAPGSESGELYIPIATGGTTRGE